jgi:uncharacterized protein (DUF305 family)
MTTCNETKAVRRGPPRLPAAAAAALALFAAAVAAAPAPARAGIEDSYSPGEPPVSSTWFGRVSDAAQRADREYVAGMRPHHVGALSMSREYLADPGRSSPLLQALARAIIANQSFEIGMLDEVARNLDRAPVPLLGFGVALQPQATEGLTGAQRFFKEPVPGPLAHAVGPVSERDVRFAKAMIVHHEAAVEMARAYHGNPDGRNGYLGLMNVDVAADQTQEIVLMRRVAAAFPGDPDAVRVDPSMVHGMEGMRHGGGHAAAVEPAAAAADAPPPARAGDGRAGRKGGHGQHRHHHGHHHEHHRHGDHAGHHDDHGKQRGAGHHGRHGHHHAADGARSGAATAQRPQPRPAAAAPRPRPATPAAEQGHHGHHH